MRLIVLSLLITWLMASLDRVIGCTVAPSAAAVLAGNSISITCRPTSDEYINQWRRQNENRQVYVAQSPITNRAVADGYSVNDTNPKEIILTLKSASIQYADNYVCICFNSLTTSTGYTYISVIESEPQFNTATNSLSSNDPVLLTCSLVFAGNANLFMQITNSAGKVFAEISKTITTNGSQQFNLDYSTSIAIEKIYFCNITLPSDASDPKTIFNRSLTTTVQFSARNVSISPESPERCQNGGFCETHSVIRCKAEGNPEPIYNFTIIYQNGTTEISPTDKYTVKYVGQQVIQCTASNEINGNVYSSQSTSFTTNGTEASRASFRAVSSNAALIGGLVGGIVGGLLLILIIVVIIVCYTRQKNGLNSKNEGVYTRPQVSQSPNERESPYTDLDLSNNATVTDTRNDRSTTGSYDFVI